MDHRTGETSVDYQILLDESLRIVPRVLGLMDRQDDSRTFGCSDRSFWHYLMHDIPNARLQDSGWFLSLIYSVDSSRNRFFKINKILEWALAPLTYWTRIQYRNGAFDEVYPFEYSYCATAFSTWWVGEALLELTAIDRERSASEKLISVKDYKTIAAALTKAGRWLMNHSNIEVANQEAAAAVALKVISIITGKEEFLDGAKKKIDRLLRKQHPDGFFSEYSGWDIGYLSLTLSCLATYCKHDETHQKLTDSLWRAVRFIASKVDRNGLYDWRKTSRQTQYLYPYGFAECWNHGGKHVLEKYLNGLAKDYVIRPSWLDDRYCTFMSIDYLRTYQYIDSKHTI